MVVVGAVALFGILIAEVLGYEVPDADGHVTLYVHIQVVHIVELQLGRILQIVEWPMDFGVFV